MYLEKHRTQSQQTIRKQQENYDSLISGEMKRHIMYVYYVN